MQQLNLLLALTLNETAIGFEPGPVGWHTSALTTELQEVRPIWDKVWDSQPNLSPTLKCKCKPATSTKHLCL